VSYIFYIIGVGVSESYRGIRVRVRASYGIIDKSYS
jgi:hypothetical protein